ncbi:hypothetical protein C2S52_002290 [Perilla frutescens var. hirtella]|nr:hypothetical protein C2S52_002290 [Perilla frutescens var. hirtella]
MAVAGLHNVPDFARSFFGESQKRDSGRWDDDHCRRSNRASALLQMWREIEGEHVLSESQRSRHRGNGSDSECISTSTSIGGGSENGDAFSQVSDESENQGFSSSETEHEDNNSVISEQSSDLGEVERERVRQTFREWMNSCPKGHSSFGFNRKNRSRHGVGDTECERARDGLVIHHPEIGVRRPLRRLCGRQTLLDLLMKAQNERKRELLSLSEQRPVSDFAHRNRIQALLRGRFLRNGRLAVDERPSSVAATELGFLRQRHAVSDLREGFLSKLDNSASASANSTEPDSSYSDENKGESESTCTEGGVTRNHIAADLEGTTADENRNMQELEVQNVEAEEPVSLNEVSLEDVPVCAESASRREESTSASEARQHRVFTHVDHCGREQINVTITNESFLEPVDLNCSGPSELYNENTYPRGGVSPVHEGDDRTADLEGNANEEFDSHDASQQSVTEIEDSVWPQLNTVAFTDWADGSIQDTDRSWQERASSQSFPAPSGNNVEEQDQMQESHDWPSHDLQEAIDSWLDMPSSEAGESVREIETLYFPFDDNANSVELRELFSRRRVSSLLGSGFRESLDQVLQSHVERLGHASVDWESESASLPPLIEQEQEQLNVDQPLARSENAERDTFAQSSTLFQPSQQLWNEDLLADWPLHYSNQQLETEWNVINELRIDMARLQQRMNNMQGMLETCMDMQIELQRSLHQEVSAALNRPISSGDSDASKDTRFHDESRWDHVKRGICCLCQHSKIDSLLYRCGHMCTCTNCAESLVQSKGKCPMCRAPAVEAVRAYFVQ